MCPTLPYTHQRLASDCIAAARPRINWAANSAAPQIRLRSNFAEQLYFITETHNFVGKCTDKIQCAQNRGVESTLTLGVLTHMDM